MTCKKTEWDKIAAKEGRIYCQKEDTWCAFINMETGKCIIKNCVNEKDGAING